MSPAEQPAPAALPRRRIWRYLREGSRHRPGGAWSALISVGSVAAALYVLWVGALAVIVGDGALWAALWLKGAGLPYGALDSFSTWARAFSAQYHLDISIFIAITFPIAFLTTTAYKERKGLAWTDIVLAALSFVVAGYYIVYAGKFLNWSRGFTLPTLADIVVGFTLLGLVIEQVTGRPLFEVLRDGVLNVEGSERLVYQPAEAPTDPMAMPLGEPRAALEQGGGYLPSIADASSAGPAGALASDSASLAQWWRAFCAGEIVSQASLTEMATFVGGADGYGLGLYDIADGGSVGHAGQNFGYVSWAGCLLDEGAVIVVLSNYLFDNIGGMAEPLVRAVRAD